MFWQRRVRLKKMIGCYLGMALSINILLFSLLPVGSALAVPVAPGKVQLNQPDGTAIQVYPFGDENESGYEYETYTIVRESASGYWVYAELSENGRLLPGNRRAGIDPTPASLPPHLRAQRAQALADLPHISDVWGGASGAQKVLVILTDFTPSKSMGTSDAAWNQLFFDTTAGVKSVRNYYRAASYNNFDLQPASESYGTANDGVIAVTLNYAHPDSYPTNDNNKLISKNALIAADPYIDYSGLDTDHSGTLDVNEVHIMIIVRGYEASYGGIGVACRPLVWGHRGGLVVGSAVPPPTLDGVVVAGANYGGGYTEEGEWHEHIADGCDGSAPGHMATPGIMVHELGHDIDWPDLYDHDGPSNGVGRWSVMGNGSWGNTSGEYIGATPTLPGAFLTWYQKWLTPVQVTQPTSGVAIPNSAQNASAYLLGFNPNGVDWDFADASGTGEYFLIENRQQVGFDAGLWRIDAAGNAKGCLIWHIDETRTYANSANDNEARKLVDVEEANGVQDLDITPTNSGDTGDPWPGSTSNTAFNASSTPNSNWYDGSASGIAVTNISTAGTGCTLDFSGVGPAWSGATSSDWNTTSNWDIGRVPGANENIVIPSGATYWPEIAGATSVGNLNILNGAHLTASANVALDVYGSWGEAGSGYFDASAGTVVLKGGAPQTITTTGSSHFNHLQIGSGSTSQTVTAGSDLDINGNLTVQAGAKLNASSRTLRVGGNWTDYPLGFAPGSSSVIFDGATPTIQRSADERVAYSSDFSSTTGWRTVDVNGDSSTWAPSNSAVPPDSPDSGLHARYFPSTTNAANDWLFSPGFTLQAGLTYTIRFNYGAWDADLPEKLEVKIGTAQTAGAMLATLFDNNNITNTAWQPGSGTFTPTTTGTYYIGFHCYSAANQGYPAVDDLSVTTADPKPTFYNLSVSGSGTTTLGDNTAVQNNLAVNSGATLALGSYTLSVEGSLTHNGRLQQTQTVTSAGATFLNIKNAAGSTDKYYGVVLTPDGSMGATTVTISGNQNCSSKSTDPLIRRCFNLAPTTPQNTTVRLYYTYAELNSRTYNALKLWHWDSAWVQAGDTYTYSSACASGQQDCWMQAQNVSSFSPFVLGGETQGPTAVGLRALNATSTSASLLWLALPLLAALGVWAHKRLK